MTAYLFSRHYTSFSSWSTARERKIEHRVPKNVVRRMSIGGGL
jgi:hypothetical protein